jgi:hypothetical protein
MLNQQQFSTIPQQAPSPTLSHRSFGHQRPGSANLKSTSPYLYTVKSEPYPAAARRPSYVQRQPSHDSTTSSLADSEEDGSKDENRSTRAAMCEACGKRFQDIKAHRLTHLTERPEKCSIVSCEYHTKGFARKYDCQRHTLTHYKGTMVCGFCPNSGSAAEKTFNRADVFKRHLLTVHNVEQPPPNGRKRHSSGSSNSKSSNSASAAKTNKDDEAAAPARCSICSMSFDTAQAFYDHLDNCVLIKVGQEEPSESINAANMASVEGDSFVQTLIRSHPTTLPPSPPESNSDSEDSEDGSDNEDNNMMLDSGAAKAPVSKRRAAKGPNGVFTYSAGGVPSSSSSSTSGSKKSKSAAPLVANGGGRKKRTPLPPNWGTPAAKLTMKKRGLYIFDGPRRLWKDDMMLSNELEVRLDLGDGQWCTDLDVSTLERAEAVLDASDAEKGPWEARDMGWGAGQGVPESFDFVSQPGDDVERDFGF